MTNIVYIKEVERPKINKKEILRYASVKENTPEIDSLIDSCIEECDSLLSYKVCHGVYPVKIDGENLDFGFASVRSHSLSLCLKGCSKIILFCATVGIGIDRLIAKHSLLSPSRAVILQALGSERVESLCDSFCSALGEEYSNKLCPRFSPGYGDLPLNLQEDIFKALSPASKIGVSLGKDMFMTPSKSVTAIIGIKDN